VAKSKSTVVHKGARLTQISVAYFPFAKMSFETAICVHTSSISFWPQCLCCL